MVCISKQNVQSLLPHSSSSDINNIVMGQTFMNRAERRATKKEKKPTPLLEKRERYLKPNFTNDIREHLQTAQSPFADAEWLQKSLTLYCETVWQRAVDAEQERIKKQCIKSGRMDMFGRWKD
jgi:hypothetical protein